MCKLASLLIVDLAEFLPQNQKSTLCPSPEITFLCLSTFISAVVTKGIAVAVTIAFPPSLFQLSRHCCPYLPSLKSTGSNNEGRCACCNYLYINNCKRSVILPCLQANKLASYCFMGARRRYKTPRSGTKYLMTSDTYSSLGMVLVSVPRPLSPMEVTQWA